MHVRLPYRFATMEERGPPCSGPVQVDEQSNRHTYSSEDTRMPSRTRAADRVKHSDERSELWVRTPYWDEAVETAFQDHCASGDVPDAWAMVSRFMDEGLSVSLREYEGSYCATLSDGERKRDGKPALLSGWGESAHDALLVVEYKHRVLLDADWDNSEASKPRRPRR